MVRAVEPMRAAVEFSQAHAAALDIPILLVFAGDDHLVDARDSEQFSGNLAPGVATVRRYDDFYHEIFNEAGAARVFEDAGAWLENAALARHDDETPEMPSGRARSA